MSIKYRVKNMDSIVTALRNIYKDVTRSEVELTKIAQFLRDRVVAETRKGNDLTQGGRKQPPLSEGYIDYRVRVDRGEEGVRGDPTFFKVNVSNLTLTGQMLDSIEYKITPSQNKIVIEPTGVRDDGLRNVDVAMELANRSTRLAPRGRKFLGVDDRGYKRVRALVVEAIRRMALRKGL